MAKFSSALSAVKSQLTRFVPEQMIFNAAAEAGHKWRARKQDPAMVVYLLLVQLLAGVSLLRLDRVAQLGVSAVAVCKARKKLPLAVLMKLAEWTGRSCRACGKVTKYLGHRVFLVDGTTLTTPDTAELSAEYAKASNQRKARPGYPAPKLLALMDWATGTIAKVIDIPKGRGEASELTGMIKSLKRNDLVVADRGLVSYAHVACFMKAGICCLMRLPRPLVVHGKGKGSRKRLKKLGRQDMLVRWDKPKQHKLKWMGSKQWHQLPESLVLRQVAFQLHRPGFRSHWVWVITTLTDPVTYTAQSLAELYGKRWKIELGFRDLKKSLKMDHLTAKSVDGIKKQILAFVILYNLVRRLTYEAAEQQNVPPDRISFLDAATALLWLAKGQPMPELRVNPQRTRPSEPRARKHGGYRYPALQQPRQKLQKPHAEARVGKAAA
jgi:hypothetical protein